MVVLVRFKIKVGNVKLENIISMMKVEELIVV